MIDLSLIRTAIKNAGLSAGDGSACSELVLQFGQCDESKVDSPEVVNFDCFEFAWDRLPRSDKFRLISIAYRDKRELFQTIKMDSPVKWADFNLAQQSVLFSVAADTLKAAFTLFSDEQFAADYRSGFLGAARVMRTELEKETIKIVRGVA